MYMYVLCLFNALMTMIVPCAPHLQVICGSQNELTTTEQKFECTGLQPSSHHEVTVAASNSAGPGPEISVQTETACPGNIIHLMS